MANMFYKSFLMLGLKRTDGQTVDNPDTRHIHGLRKRGIYNQRRRPEAQARNVHAVWRVSRDLLHIAVSYPDVGTPYIYKILYILLIPDPNNG